VAGGVVGGVAGGVVGGVAGGVAGGVEWRTAGDEYVLVGCNGGGAAGDDVLGDADGSVVADVTAGSTDTGAGAEDDCPAGCSSWMDGCPVNEVSANAAAPPAPTRPPRISATTSGFTRRRRGGRPVPGGMGGGMGGGVAGG
jgi:hypothetical protein